VKHAQIPTSLRAIEDLDHWFEIDELVETVQLLDSLSKAANPASQKELVDRGIALLKQANAESRPDVAGPVMEFLTRSAEKSAMPDLVKRVGQVRLQQEQLIKERGQLLDLEAKLKATPNDPEANRMYGLLLAARGEWPKALKHLAQGDDAALAKLADRDIKNPADAKLRADLGLAWADLAGKSTDWKSTYFSRSKYWLELAQAGLVGEEKSKITLKLGEVSAQLSSSKPMEKDPPATTTIPKPGDGPKKPADIARRNFDTIKTEAIYKAQWKPDGAVRVEANGLRLQSGEAKLESRFQLVDNWRVEIIVDHDGRESSVDVNGHSIPLRVGPRPGAVIIERKGKRLIYTRSQTPTRFAPPIALDIAESNLGPSAMTIKITGMITSNALPEGTLIQRISVTGPVRMEEARAEKE
jgi:hypothetical protein